jgi:hypothetical protein
MSKPEKTDPASGLEYAVLITQRRDGFELHVRELLLTVRAPTLQAAYDELLERRRELIEDARIIGKLDSLPAPDAPPPIGRKSLNVPG